MSKVSVSIEEVAKFLSITSEYRSFYLSHIKPVLYKRALAIEEARFGKFVKRFFIFKIGELSDDEKVETWTSSDGFLPKGTLSNKPIRDLCISYKLKKLILDGNAKGLGLTKEEFDLANDGMGWVNGFQRTLFYPIVTDLITKLNGIQYLNLETVDLSVSEASTLGLVIKDMPDSLDAFKKLHELIKE